MRSLQALLAVAMLLIVAVFAGVNVTPVRVNYVLGNIELPLAVALYVALAVGVLCGVAGASGMVLRARRSARRARAEARNLAAATPAVPPLQGAGTAPGVVASPRR